MLLVKLSLQSTVPLPQIKDAFIQYDVRATKVIMSQDFRVLPFKSLGKFDIMGKNVYRMQWTGHLRVLLCSDIGTNLTVLK